LQFNGGSSTLSHVYVYIYILLIILYIGTTVQAIYANSITIRKERLLLYIILDRNQGQCLSGYVWMIPMLIFVLCDVKLWVPIIYFY